MGSHGNHSVKSPPRLLVRPRTSDMDQGRDCRWVHEYSDSMSGTSWNVLVYIYQHDEMGFLVNTGYVALNGVGIESPGNKKAHLIMLIDIDKNIPA